MSYNVATLARLEPNTDGSVRMVLSITGNAGEAPVDYYVPYEANSPPDSDFVRGLAMKRMVVLNQTRNFFVGATAAVGQVLDTTTPLPTATVSTFGSYCAASPPFTPGTTPQDVFSITGSATKKVTVVRIGITTVQTTAGMNAWTLVKRSSANTGGTSASVTAVPTDDAHPASTATVLRYTANPTAGTLIGNIWAGRVAAPAPASAPAGDFEKSPLQGIGMFPVVLTGTTDVLAWNFGGAALPTGLSVQATVWWSES